MPLLGRVIKGATKAGAKMISKAAKADTSSASKKLVGTVMERPHWEVPKYIKDVVYDTPSTRTIRFTDGTILKATRQDINRMVTEVQAEKGRKEAYQRGALMGEDERDTALSRGLRNAQKYIEGYQAGIYDEDMSWKLIRHKNLAYQSTLKKTGIQVAPYVMIEIEGLLVPMHRAEAEALVGIRKARYHRHQGSARVKEKETNQR